MEPAVIAAIAGLQVLLLTIVTWALNRQSKKEDYQRQDLVADRVAKAAEQAAEAASLLVRAQTETSKRLDEVANVRAAESVIVQAQLKAITDVSEKIHILVNSDMTAARTNERDQTKLTLLALKRVQALSVNLGLATTQDELDAIKVAEERIVKLDAILADRHAAQKRVDKEQANAKELEKTAPAVTAPNPPDSANKGMK